MYVDELSFSMINGIDMPVNPLMKVKLYPNPAADVITLSTEKPLQNGVLAIYDISGKQISTHSFDGSLLRLDVSSYSTGKYFYTLRDKKLLLNTGEFVISE